MGILKINYILFHNNLNTLNNTINGNINAQNTPINNLLFVEINIPNKEPKLDVLQYIIYYLN